MKPEQIVKQYNNNIVKNIKTIKLYGKYTWTVNISHEMQLGKFLKSITLD